MAISVKFIFFFPKIIRNISGIYFVDLLNFFSKYHHHLKVGKGIILSARHITLIVCIKVSPPPPSKTPPSFFSQAPLKSGNCLTFLFGQFPPIYWLFGNPPPTLEIGFFTEPPIILKFFILNPHLVF